MSRKKPCSDEKGISLLFTLIILGLLLVLALAFAANSIFEQRAAMNAANTASARLLCHATMNRVLKMLEQYDPGSTYSARSDNSVIHSPSPYPGFDDFIYRLGTNYGDGSSVFNWKNSYLSRIRWEYIHQDNGTNNNIIGRTAYVLLAEGQLDPAACVKLSVDEGNGYPEDRVGAEINEVNLQSAFTYDNRFAASRSANLATVMSYTGISRGAFDGQLPLSGTWIDFPNLFTKLKSEDLALNQGEKDYFMRCFVIDAPQEKEAYWLDDNGDGKLDEATEFYNRFSLVRTDWSDLYVDPGKSNMGSMFAAPSIWGNADAGGIPWLSNFGKKIDGTDDQALKGTYTDVATRRKQIMANFIDYCDDDSEATTDDSDWVGGTPTYAGNEKTPLLSEIGVIFHANVFRVPGGTSTVTLEGLITGELINLYGEVFDKDTELELIGEYTYTIQFSGGNDIRSAGSSFDVKIDLKNALVPWVNGYKMRWSHAADFVSVADSQQMKASVGNGACPSVWVYDVQVKIKRAILRYDNKNADLVLFADTASFSCPTMLHAAGNNNNQGIGEPLEEDWYFYACMAARDPRQNLNSDDWIVGSYLNNIDSEYFKCGGTTAASNYGTDAEAAQWPSGWLSTRWMFSPAKSYATQPNACDFENTDDPVDVSTNYIRNSSPKSPWELGFIHRGEMWQTINLKAYDETKAVSPGTGGGDYAAGDANILDQIKMTPANKSAKKINIMAQKGPALVALLNKIKVGSDKDNPANGGTALDYSSNPTAIDNLLDAIQAKSFNFKTRGAVATVAELFEGTCGVAQNNDAKQEELLGKFVNLTSVWDKHEYYTLIIVSQTIKDVGDAAGTMKIRKDLDKNGNVGIADENSAKYDIDGDGAATSSDIKEEVYAQIGKYDQYADEITSEQKILIRVKRDPSGKCTVLGVEYVE